MATRQARADISTYKKNVDELNDLKEMAEDGQLSEAEKEAVSRCSHALLLPCWPGPRSPTIIHCYCCAGQERININVYLFIHFTLRCVWLRAHTAPCVFFLSVRTKINGMQAIRGARPLAASTTAQDLQGDAMHSAKRHLGTKGTTPYAPGRPVLSGAWVPRRHVWVFSGV
jgi:hypothetical protein